MSSVFTQCGKCGVHYVSSNGNCPSCGSNMVKEKE